MPQGLQVWNSSGQLIIDTSTSIGKVLGITTITAGVSGNIADTKFALGTPFWSLINQGPDSYGASPIVSYNSGLTRLEWTNSAAYNNLLVYGVL